jgi:hypothetical protein
VIGRFIADRCIVGTGHVIADDLYKTWRDWCLINGEDWGSQTMFCRRLSELHDDEGNQQFPRSKLLGRRVRTGLTLRPTDNDERTGSSGPETGPRFLAQQSQIASRLDQFSPFARKAFPRARARVGKRLLEPAKPAQPVHPG